MNDSHSLTPKQIADKEAYLLKYSGSDRVVTSEEMRKELAQLAPQRIRYSTGIKGLDAYVHGVEAGELIAIGGERKNGKTLLAQSLTANFAKQGAKVTWFSFEVQPRQFLSQMPENVHFFMPRELRPYRMDWLFDRTWESKLKYETRLVVIDNLHHLLDLTTTRNVSLDIGSIIRGLKRTAIEHNIIIFILCHSRKPDFIKGKPNTEISDFNLRDSSFIPQESDTTWMIQRLPDKESGEITNQAMLKVCTHRRTGAWNNIVNLVKRSQLLEELVEYDIYPNAPIMEPMITLDEEMPF